MTTNCRICKKALPKFEQERNITVCAKCDGVKPTKMLTLAKTPLERNVARWIDKRTHDYDGRPEGILKDLFYGGCESGIVGTLIYYKDTLAYYRKFRKEIDALLHKTMQNFGNVAISDVFDDKWDKTDPLARDTNNRNLLAWFGFEETARILADRAEV
jgi:hypothetical protein